MNMKTVMTIEFEDGRKIEFKKFDGMWLSESVIWEKTTLRNLLDLRELKAKIAQWFDDNAPEDVKGKYEARLPMWNEIEPLSFKDQVAYGEGETNLVVEYFLGDENHPFPVCCCIGYHYGDNEGFRCYIDSHLKPCHAIRICLEERK